MIIEYKLVTGEWSSSFELEINRLLKEGWEILGDTKCSMAKGPHSSGALFCQALVKTDDSNKSKQL